MANFNKVMLMGRLTRDPELRFTPNGAAVASFGLAVNRRYKQGEEWKEEVCFVDVSVWGKQGENCAQYLHKGSNAFIEGHLRFHTWEGDGGQKRSKLDVVATIVQFLDRPGAKGDAGSDHPAEQSEKDDVPF